MSIKNKILEVFFNYINDPNNFKEKAAFSFLKNYVENEKSKEFQNELIQHGFDDTYLYELIFKTLLQLLYCLKVGEPSRRSTMKSRALPCTTLISFPFALPGF